MPYLRIFDLDHGAWEAELTKDRTVVGRSFNQADIVINDATVSRAHAIFAKKEDRWVVADAGSRGGIKVNQQPTKGQVLNPGDSVELGCAVVEFRTDDEAFATAQNQGSGKIIQQLRKSFRLLPTAVTLRYRQLQLDAASIFSSGDTISIGAGGILLPSLKPLAQGSVLEVEIQSPNSKKILLAEVLAVLTDKQPNDMCLKLHGVAKDEHADMLRHAQRGSWLPGWPMEKFELNATLGF